MKKLLIVALLLISMSGFAFTQPEDFKPAPGQTAHFLSSGTFALQGHDPNSEVHFKNILVKVLD